MTYRFSALLAAALVTGGVGGARAADTLSPADSRFVAMVSQGGMFEVQAGRLAAEQGHLQDIKDQGATEAHDHELVGTNLKTIVTGAGGSFPDALNDMFQQKLASLKALSGPAFDTAYVREMKAIHDKDGAAFAQEAKAGSNPQLRQFAAETHRIVVMHIGELRGVALE